MHRAQLIPLRLNKAQTAYVSQGAGSARFAFNWALAEWKRQAKEWWDSGKVSPYPSAYALQRQFNAIKGEQFPWINEVAAEIPEKAIYAVELAFKAFRSGQCRYPRFKARGRHNSFVGASRTERVRIDGNSIRLPRIGALRLGCRFRWPEAVVAGAVVSERAGKWFVAVRCELPDQPLQVERAAGVDLGIKCPLAVTSGDVSMRLGEGLAERLNVERRRLRRANQRLHRRVKGSGRRRRAQARIARVHRRMANIRADFQHKATHLIAGLASTIGVETLAVRNMMRSGRVARSIADVGFYEIKRQLKYKAQRVIEADRFYPSSKTCSSCGSIKETLSLSDRVFHCEHCGFECDRDENAARNLEQMAANCVVSARGAGSPAPERKLRSSSPAVKREARKGDRP